MKVETKLCPAQGWVNLNQDGVKKALCYWQSLACRLFPLRPDNNWGYGNIPSPEQLKVWEEEYADELRADAVLKAAYDTLSDKVTALSSSQEVMEWAKEVILLARKTEHNPPHAGYKLDDACFLYWNGTWTVGRKVCLLVWENEDGMHGHLSWDTGTGEPSRFLSDICDFITEEAEVN